MCKIIVMANQKGGVAKTSSTRNLAYSLAELGKKVLAVDFDPQTNLTISFGVAPAALQETAASLMMKLVMDEALPEKESCILNIGKVDLLPSKKTLTVAEVNLLIERKDDCLAKLLAPLRADYDYILVDTGPSLGSLTINAFTAADEIIIPVDPELFALVGLKELTETISIGVKPVAGNARSSASCSRNAVNGQPYTARPANRCVPCSATSPFLRVRFQLPFRWGPLTARDSA